MDYKKVIEEAQAALRAYLVPDGITAEQAIDRLLQILDNRELVAYMQYQEAITAAAGNATAIIHGYGTGPVLLIGDAVFGGLTDAALEKPKPMPIVVERLVAAEYFHEKPLHPKHQEQQARRATRKKRG